MDKSILDLQMFSCFAKLRTTPIFLSLIVHKECGQLGAEYGIHGSSTRQVTFENIEVPVENLLERNGVQDSHECA